MISALRIGIWVAEAGSWFGGISYVENLVKSIATLPQRPKLVLVCTTSTRQYLERFQSIHAWVDQFVCLAQSHPWQIEEEIFSGIICQTYAQLFEQIDFLYPCLQAIDSTAVSYPHAAWIPDFQHVDLPQFFAQEDIDERNALFSEISVRSPLLVLSSQHTAGKFQSLYPDSPTIRRILSFHTFPDNEWYDADPAEIVSTYQLPDRFLICNNQFWQHKGHTILFDAIAQLQQCGHEISVVCTGDTSDYRNAGYFQQLQQQIRDLRLSDQVYILGAIPRHHQMQLMRQSLAIVQPSNYEGWSTIVEEAQTLGKPIVLSDFPVHLEQNPDRALYFSQGKAQSLAATLSEALPTLVAGVDPASEAIARQRALERATAFAKQFCQIAWESQFIFSRKPQTMSSQLWDMLSAPLTLNPVSNSIAPPSSTTHPAAEPSMAQNVPIQNPSGPDDVEHLRSQLRRTQLELTQAQAELRQVFTLRRNVNQAVEQAKVFKASAEERLSGIQHLNQVAEERSRLIEQLHQVAEERLQLIEDLSQAAEERLVLNESLEHQANEFAARANKFEARANEFEARANEFEAKSTRSQQKVERLQQRVEKLKRSLDSSKQQVSELEQQISELEQKVVYLSSLQGISRTLRKKILRRS
ncbi:MAG: glycosyltransferase [Leptolyngbyaceae cyanobacterium CRU_2_3]|nr:glycosyltransferase [Leptolyngbyaceae cyanobacterium CRU_2_3]